MYAISVYQVRVIPLPPPAPLVGVRFSAGIDGGAADGATVGPSAEQQLRMTKFVKRLVWYPAVLIVSWTFATVNRIQNAAHPDEPIFGLFLLHVSSGCVKDAAYLPLYVIPACI